ncbi:putative pre-rRNA-processing protein Rix1 [Plasmopara halstedii]
MAANSRAVETALARNLLSSILALAISSDLDTNNAAIETFMSQQVILCEALERHNVFGLVTDGKALSKWQNRLIEFIGGSSKASRIGWELMLITIRQSPLERLEALTVNLLDRAVKVFKRQQSSNNIDETMAHTIVAICGVMRVLLLHVEKYNPETRREALELLPKLLQSLVVLMLHTTNASMAIAQFKLVSMLMCETPNALRGFAVKIESACVNVLFSNVDGCAVNEKVVEEATVCLATLCNVFDDSQQVWIQMVQKALEVAHQQLDLLAKNRVTMAPVEEVTKKKPWAQEVISHQLPIYQRVSLTLNRMVYALCVLHELLNVSVRIKTRRHVSEREVQQVLSDIISFVRRAMGVRAHEVGKHTGLSDDGVRFPVSVVYAVLPCVHVQALRVLSATIERAGICALRHAGKVTRVLLLASESVGDGEDLKALADATSVCARCLGASTVEKLGVPLLNELILRCERTLDDEASSICSFKPVASVQHNDLKNSGNKSKKRKRQAAAAATLAALKNGNAATNTRFVSLRDETVIASNLNAILMAVATCVSVYGSLLPQQCRSLTSKLILKSVQCRHVVLSQDPSVVDPVVLALLSDALTADALGSHGANLLEGNCYWQRRSIGISTASSTLQLIALNASEAVVHPRAPPISINFQQHSNKEENHNSFSDILKPTKEFTIQGDVMDWDENEQNNCDDEDGKVEPVETKHLKSPIVETNEEEEEVEEVEKVEEDYEDVHPQAAPKDVERMQVDDISNKKHDAEEGDDGPTAQWMNEKSDTFGEADQDDDDFPDIVVDDE